MKNKFKKQYQFDKDIFKNSEGKIGIVVTNEKEFDILIEKLSNYGFTYEYGETLLGSSYKETLTEIIFTTKLYHLPTHISFISLDGDIFSHLLMINNVNITSSLSWCSNDVY